MNINVNLPANRQPLVGPGMMGGANQSMQFMGMMFALMTSLMSNLMGGPSIMGGHPGFGGSSPLGMGGGQPMGLPGGANFLGGGSGGGGGAAPARSAGPTVDPSTIQGTGWGAALAKDAAANANGPGGYCYKWVAQALRRHGVNVSGASAYMGADQLAKNPKFREVQVAPQDLKKLPAGAVVVWNKGAGHPHGHISIALGNGKEASDKIRDQITNYGTSVRVFMPK